MPLPVLSAARAATDADLLRLFHKTERAWAEHLGEATQLDAGVAVVAADLPGVWDGNRVLEAAVPPGWTPADAVAEVEAHFAATTAAADGEDAAGTTDGPPAIGVRPPSRCGEWVLNPSAPPDRTAPLADHLLALGYTAVTNDVMALGPADRPVMAPPTGVTVLPARAAFRHARALAAEAAAERFTAGHAPASGCAAGEAVAGGAVTEVAVADDAIAGWAEAHLRHLDDPHVDALLALRDGRAVGRAAVLAVGDVGRIDDVYVAPNARRQGVGRLLLARALEVCARSVFRHVLLGVPPDNFAAIALYRSFGFRKVGTTTAYWRKPAVEPTPAMAPAEQDAFRSPLPHARGRRGPEAVRRSTDADHADTVRADRLSRPPFLPSAPTSRPSGE